jgi:hypothetical protein
VFRQLMFTELLLKLFLILGNQARNPSTQDQGHRTSPPPPYDDNLHLEDPIIPLAAEASASPLPQEGESNKV